MGQEKRVKPDPQLIYRKISELYPDAGCELDYVTETDLLVAIILSQQATDVSVNKLTKTLFAKYKTFADYAQAPLADLEADIRAIGLFRTKAKNIQMASRIIQSEYGGIIPMQQELLEKLPGVGRKTANVFLAEWHKLPRIAVDTHVKRVATRLGLAKDKDTPETVEKKLMEHYPPSEWIPLHHRFLFFGRYLCKARKPECWRCPLIDVCHYPDRY
ncbi:MAG: endonuclease III [Candidatus Izemoplasmatales bacterium]